VNRLKIHRRFIPLLYNLTLAGPPPLKLLSRQIAHSLCGPVLLGDGRDEAPTPPGPDGPGGAAFLYPGIHTGATTLWSDMRAGPHPQGSLTFAKGKREPSRGPRARRVKELRPLPVLHYKRCRRGAHISNDPFLTVDFPRTHLPRASVNKGKKQGQRALDSGREDASELRFSGFLQPFLEGWAGYYRFLCALHYSCQLILLWLRYFEFIQRLLKVVHECFPLFNGDH
jgi:hypothetical protein